jgi:hypothetical protein
VNAAGNASGPSRDERHVLSERLCGRRLRIALLSVCPPAFLPPLAIVDPSVLHAQETAPRQIVDVTVAAKDEEVDPFLAGLREPLEELGLTVRAWGAGDEARPPPSGAPKTRVRVVVDARPLNHVDIEVWVTPSARTAPVQRRVPRAASTAVVIEDVAYAVRATVESLLAELAPQARPPDGTAQEGAATPTPARNLHPARFGLDVAGFASVLGVASSVPAFGGGAALDFAFWGRQPGRPGLYMAASLRAPFDTSTNEVTLETMAYSLRAVPEVELARAGPLHVAAGGGVGVDIFHAQPHPADASSATLSSPTTLVDPVLEAQVLLRVAIRGASLLFGFDLDYDLNPDRFNEINRNGDSSSVLKEWTVRPAAMLGLCLPVAGVSACRETE